MALLGGPFKRRQWLASLAFGIHNAEEVIWLPSWSRQAGRWHPAVDDAPFRFAVGVLTMEGVAISAWTARSGCRSRGATASGGLCVMLLANALFAHLAGTIALKRYVPGTATAVGLNVPIAVSLLCQGLAEDYLTPDSIARGGLLITGLAAVQVPILMRAAHWLREAGSE